ncbi:MAG: acetolactate synthase small subunit [Ktedonobacteraceae bacterium]|nr:acetolactate synthase small subunit [Ktedonobacteraceae bacterium]
MTTSPTPTLRAGQSNLPPEQARDHTLIIFLEERPGSVDRLVGLFRRRRGNLRTFVLGRTEVPSIVRITAVVNDSEVGADQLVEQLRKIVDVRRVENPTPEQTISRELTLVRVNSTPASFHSILDIGQMFGAHAIDITKEAVTLEVTGTREKIDTLIERLQPYGIREVARSGCVAMTRDTEDPEHSDSK